jgi:hypothetical protein
MRRIPTMMASAGAAALTTLAVSVAVPAIGDDGASPQTADPFAACLRANGLDGAPDGKAALKPWLDQRLATDPTAKRALDTCSPPDGGPQRDEQRLRSCLKDHGIEVAGDDPAALKRWIGEHHDDAATAAALKACDAGFVDKSKAVTCGKDGPAGEAVPAKPADKTDTTETPAANATVPAGT